MVTIKYLLIRRKYLVFFSIIILIILFASIYVLASDTITKKYIKWVDFTPPTNILKKTASYDISSHQNNEKIKYDWIELLSFLAAKYGGNFNRYNQSDLDSLIMRLKNGEDIDDITADMKYYGYYHEAYSAILKEYIGYYSIESKDENGKINYITKYGIKAFLPIAKGYNFNHYKDFGSSRSYGYKRTHLGNDLMGSIGTPIIAVESGTIEAIGWNQYGGWRIGIRSFDKKRYYYYAHLRRNHPYSSEFEEGQIIKAGDVIGYLGMTGYSIKENVNNINVPHLHFGIQLIFDESQKDGTNQIWIDVYNIIEFLRQNTSEVYYNKQTNETQRKYEFIEKNLEE